MEVQRIKLRYQENTEIPREYKKEIPRKDERMWQGSECSAEVKQGPYFICAICHQSLYQCSVRLFMYEKYLILRAELHHPVKSFNEKLYILETWHKHLNENEISCRRFSNKMALYPIPDELKILKKLEKLLISERILFKKIAIIHGKGEFSKVMGSICNILTETANIYCNTLTKPAVSNG